MREVGAKTDDGRVSRAMTQCRLLLLGGGNPYVKIDSGQNGTKFTDCLKFSTCLSLFSFRGSEKIGVVQSRLIRR